VSRELQGGLRGEGLRIAIVVARFNDFITSKLLDGARAALERHGVADNDVTVVSVPGSFEIPLAAKKLAESGDHHAVICLGAVIRGETDHYEHVAGEAAKGIAAASLASGRPVIFGVLTTDTLEQAINRAGGKQGNNGYAAGLAAIEMANLMAAMDAGHCEGG
jgi:6,7-dimethyl-8-ribityllumazine synthase